MNTLEFWTSVNPDRTLTLPADIAAQVESDQRVHVILVIPGADDQAWTRLTADQFLQGYATGDAIYDELPAG
jgi:hypothetical protein